MLSKLFFKNLTKSTSVKINCYSNASAKEIRDLGPISDETNNNSSAKKSNVSKQVPQIQNKDEFSPAGADYFKSILVGKDATARTFQNLRSTDNTAEKSSDQSTYKRFGKQRFEIEENDPKSYAKKFIYWTKQKHARDQMTQETKNKADGMKRATIARIPAAVVRKGSLIKEKQKYIEKAEDIDKNYVTTDRPIDSDSLAETDSFELTSEPRDFYAESRDAVCDKFNKYRKTSYKSSSSSNFDRKLKSEEYLQFQKEQQNRAKEASSETHRIESESRRDGGGEKEQIQLVGRSMLEIQDAKLTKEELTEEEDLSDDGESFLSAEELLDRKLKSLRPSTRSVVYNIAYFANTNPLIQKFIEMGVHVREWDKDTNIGSFILKLDFDKHIKSHLIFLHDIGLSVHDQAHVITKNPMVFNQSVDSLRTRVDYLKSKTFSQEQIASILVKAPRLLNISVENLDTKLGWFQREFQLNGQQVREIMCHMPKLVVLPLKVAADCKFLLREFLTFDNETIKSFLLLYPRMFTKNFQTIESNFNFLTQVAKLKHEDIAAYPQILTESLLLLKSRYSYLKHLNRLQFDPTEPNYVSLKSMADNNDEYFCKRVAKTSLDEYKKFLRSV